MPAETLATIEHTTTGTPAYMAPEIDPRRRGRGSARRRLRARAASRTILLTGQLVFEADTSMKMLMQHLHAQPVPPSQRTELPIPRELDELVLACLQKDPEQAAAERRRAVSNGVQLPRVRRMERRDGAAWWQSHLPELTGPLGVGEHSTSGIRRVARI